VHNTWTWSLQINDRFIADSRVHRIKVCNWCVYCKWHMALSQNWSITFSKSFKLHTRFTNGQSYTFTLFLLKLKQNLIKKTYSSFHLMCICIAIAPSSSIRYSPVVRASAFNSRWEAGAEGSSLTLCGTSYALSDVWYCSSSGTFSITADPCEEADCRL